MEGHIHQRLVEGEDLGIVAAQLVPSDDAGILEAVVLGKLPGHTANASQREVTFEHGNMIVRSEPQVVDHPIMNEPTHNRDWTPDLLHAHLVALREADLKLAASQRADDQKALELQHKEYERRLEVLNHAHEQALEVQHTYVTQDKYEEYIKQRALNLEATTSRLAEKDVEIQIALDGKITALEGALEDKISAQAGEINDLKAFKARAIGVGAVAFPILLAIGAALARAVGLS